MSKGAYARNLLLGKNRGGNVDWAPLAATNDLTASDTKAKRTNRNTDGCRDDVGAWFRLAVTGPTRVRFDLIVIRLFLHKSWLLVLSLGLSAACFDERLVKPDRDDTTAMSTDSASTQNSSSGESSSSASGSSSGEISSDETSGTPQGEQNVFHAKTCSAQDVQAALANAPDGATVQIPKGDCDWGDAKVGRQAGVWLRGAGKGQTILRRNRPVTEHGDYMLRFDCDNGLPLEVSHLSMIGNDRLQDEATKLLDYDNGLVLDNGCRDFLIYDAEFSDFSYSGLTISGLNSRGLVHHATFRNNFKCQPDPVSCLGYGVTVYGDRYIPPTSRELGTDDAVFIEDSIFYGNRHAIASNYGSRFVFRHNHVTTVLATRNFGMIDPEGKGDNGQGSATWEIYRNMLDADFGGVDETCDGIYIRGGDGVVFENIISSEYVYTVRFTLEADCDENLEHPVAGQTVDAWVWGHTPEIVEAKPGCEKYFLLDRDFKIGPKPDYKPYPYPHPKQSSENSRPWRSGTLGRR